MTKDEIKEYLEQYKNFENLTDAMVLDGQTEVYVDYFPNGTTGFLKDTSEIYMKYLRDKITT